MVPCGHTFTDRPFPCPAAVAIIVSLRAPGNILIILLALLEPAFILWLVYWRKHRKDASLDAVIKLFAVGASLVPGAVKSYTQSTYILYHS